MTAQRIDGKQIARDILDQCRQEINALKKRYDQVPCLAAILIGEDRASQLYVRNKIRSCHAIGMRSQLREFPADVSSKEVYKCLDQLNHDRNVHGILVQLPLPQQLSAQQIVAAVNPNKDVDGLHPRNIAALYSSASEGHIPCTPKGCLFLLKKFCPKLEGLHAVILGRSNLVGKPLAHLLLRQNCTVTIAHSHSRQPSVLAAQADILVSAVGIPRLVTAEWIKPGAVLIDVGINRDPHNSNAICGDIDYPAASKIAAAITPVPGGVGPMTVACLMQNCIQAFKFQVTASH